MILLDKPFVSEFLKDTAIEYAIPVVTTPVARAIGLKEGMVLLDELGAIREAKSTECPILYTNSENAIAWIATNLGFTDLPVKIDLFKDKAKFRRLIRSLYSDFYFREIKIECLDDIPVAELPMPCVIKPASGFFSMGVHKITRPEAWEQTKASIQSEMSRVHNLYPVEVLNATSFIVEQYIDGDEYAIDAYFNADGEPIITTIMKHLFASDDDVSDRVYITSKQIIEDNIDQFSTFLSEIGSLTELRNFPMHVEIRRDSSGLMIPIEINPMRFGGWCTTADLTFFAYGFNPYQYFFEQKQPDWSEILWDKEGKLFSIVVLDNSSGIAESQIEKFDFQLLLTRFRKPLELRKINYNEYPVFGFVFTETEAEDVLELEKILGSNLREFITRKL